MMRDHSNDVQVGTSRRSVRLVSSVRPCFYLNLHAALYTLNHYSLLRSKQLGPDERHRDVVISVR